MHVEQINSRSGSLINTPLLADHLTVKSHLIKILVSAVVIFFIGLLSIYLSQSVRQTTQALLVLEERYAKAMDKLNQHPLLALPIGDLQTLANNRSVLSAFKTLESIKVDHQEIGLKRIEVNAHALRFDLSAHHQDVKTVVDSFQALAQVKNVNVIQSVDVANEPRLSTIVVEFQSP